MGGLHDRSALTYAPGRLGEVRGLGERLADPRDTLRPPEDEARA